MANNEAGFLKNWGRSPRQDRRVMVDGKFVELTKPQVAVEVVNIQDETLEVVNETNGSTGTAVLLDQTQGTIGSESATDKSISGVVTAGDSGVVDGSPDAVHTEKEVDPYDDFQV